MSNEDFEILSVIGRGSYGCVYQAKRLKDNRVYVLKRIDMEFMSSKERLEAIQEAQVMATLSHVNIVKYMESFIHNTTLNIVMEYCDRGDLQTFLKANSIPLPEIRIWFMFIQMLLGLYHIHNHRIIHRDIKTANIFIHGEDIIKIGDLGVARILSGQSSCAQTIIGTPYYLSPELCQSKPYNNKSDVWALGCVLYEMATKSHPFQSNNQGELIFKIIQGKYSPLNIGKYSPALCRISKSMLLKDVKLRPSVKELLSDKSVQYWFSKFNISLPNDIINKIEDKPLRENKKIQRCNISLPNDINKIEDKALTPLVRENKKIQTCNIKGRRVRHPGVVRVIKKAPVSCITNMEKDKEICSSNYEKAPSVHDLIKIIDDDINEEVFNNNIEDNIINDGISISYWNENKDEDTSYEEVFNNNVEDNIINDGISVSYWKENKVEDTSNEEVFNNSMEDNIIDDGISVSYWNENKVEDTSNEEVFNNSMEDNIINDGISVSYWKENKDEDTCNEEVLWKVESDCDTLQSELNNGHNENEFDSF